MTTRQRLHDDIAYLRAEQAELAATIERWTVAGSAEQQGMLVDYRRAYGVTREALNRAEAWYEEIGPA